MVGEIQKRIWIKRLVGWSVALVAFYLLVNSFLWGVWQALDQGSANIHLDAMSRGAAQTVARLYHAIHIAPFLDVLVYPVNPKAWISLQNVGALVMYLVMLGSAMLIGSANRDARALRKAKARDRQRQYDIAVSGEAPRNVQRRSSPVLEEDDRGSIFSIPVVATVLAPLFVAVAGTVVTHFMGIG
ncbi:hypothetical protein [Halomonas sp. THAF12]|uniref:hypothetical protein n=1 Tax=Halomonas sp. THAF12 TaxID=2587849 RepID=UPI001267D5E8|nr:hypothetical protein [Halomonas sp. THAF12]